MRNLQTALAGVMLAAACVAPAQAGSFDVAPSTIQVPAKGGMAVLYVVNRGDKPITAQIEGFDWSQSDGKDQLTASHVLLISPPMAKLAPGQKQVVRLKIPPSGQVEGSYRLVVSELPSPQPPEQRNVRMLVQFSVPVFASTTPKRTANPKPATESKLEWDAHVKDGALTVSVHNSGFRRAKVVGLHVNTPEGEKQGLTNELFYYVLAGSTRQWTVSAPELKAGNQIEIIGRNATDDSAIQTSVQIAP